MSDTENDRARRRLRRRRSPYVAFYGPMGGNGYVNPAYGPMGGNGHGNSAWGLRGDDPFVDGFPNGNRAWSPYLPAFEGVDFGPPYGSAFDFGGHHHNNGFDFDNVPDHDQGRRDRRSAAPSPSPHRCSWLVEALERLAAELSKSGYEARKGSKGEGRRKKSESQGLDYDREAIEDMVRKLSKLEGAMKSAQDAVQGILERLRIRSRDRGADEMGGMGSPVWRQGRYRSPPPFWGDL